MYLACRWKRRSFFTLGWHSKTAARSTATTAPTSQHDQPYDSNDAYRKALDAAAVVKRRHFEFKTGCDDMENDLFRQLRMGPVAGEENAFKMPENHRFPVPIRTIMIPRKDETFAEVMDFLRERSPRFCLKLQTSFLLRLILSMLDKYYGQEIEFFEDKVAKAQHLLETRPENFVDLEEFLELCLNKHFNCPPEKQQIFELCQDTIKRVHFYHDITLENISRAMWVYMLNYHPPKDNRDELVDDIELLADGHSIYFTHMASVIRNDSEYKDGRRDVYTYRRSRRTFQAYEESLLNMLYFQCRPEVRHYLVRVLSRTRAKFVGAHDGHYTADDYNLFVKHMRFSMLPQISQIDTVQGNGTSYSEVIGDFDRLFFDRSLGGELQSITESKELKVKAKAA